MDMLAMLDKFSKRAAGTRGNAVLSFNFICNYDDIHVVVFEMLSPAWAYRTIIFCSITDFLSIIVCNYFTLVCVSNKLQ